jgi:hypothetical protein
VLGEQCTLEVNVCNFLLLLQTIQCLKIPFWAYDAWLVRSSPTKFVEHAERHVLANWPNGPRWSATLGQIPSVNRYKARRMNCVTLQSMWPIWIHRLDETITWHDNASQKKRSALNLMRHVHKTLEAMAIPSNGKMSRDNSSKNHKRETTLRRLKSPTFLSTLKNVDWLLRFDRMHRVSKIRSTNASSQSGRNVASHVRHQRDETFDGNVLFPLC